MRARPGISLVGQLLAFVSAGALLPLIACSTPTAIGCPSAATPCGGQCVDVATDAKNCGACGKACPTGAACTAGSCGAPPQCANGTTACDDGQCHDFRTDAANCGACSTSSAPTACASGQACVGGVCGSGPQCTSPLSACGADCIDTTADPNHCGGCSTVCPDGFAGAQSRVSDSSSPGATTSAAAGTTSESEVFTYADTTADVSGPGQAFSFHAPATGSGSFTFDWVYEGDHGPSQGMAGLLAGGAPPPSPPVTLQGPTPTAGPFSFSGTTTLTVTAGTDIVFQAIGGAPSASASFGGKITITGKRCAGSACEPAH